MRHQDRPAVSTESCAWKLRELANNGNPNAQVRVRNIRITQGNDVDSDGLTNDAEIEVGTAPRTPGRMATG